MNGSETNHTHSVERTLLTRDKYIRLFKIAEENNNIDEVSQSPFEGHTYAINHVEFSKDGTKLASSSLDGCTFIWNPQVNILVFLIRSEIRVLRQGKSYFPYQRTVCRLKCADSPLTGTF